MLVKKKQISKAITKEGDNFFKNKRGKNMEAQNIMTEIIVKHQTIEQNRDSLELSTPAKGGSIKIYTDFLDKELTEKKILAAIEARKFANIKLNEQ